MNTAAISTTAVALLTPVLTAQCPTGYDWRPGSTSSRPTAFATAFGRELYFQMFTASEGVELFKWTPAGGLALAADVRPGSGNSRPHEITPCCTASGPRIFFSAAGTGIDYELWAIDGTPGSQYMVKDIYPGSTASLPQDMMAVGNRVFFNADDGTHGFELWVSDGTEPGTNMVKDIYAGSLNSHPGDKVALDDLLLFVANDGSGEELWVSDGTDAGTINLGAGTALAGSNPHSLVRSGDFVYLLAKDPSTGYELWKTDGTPSGTTLVSALQQSLFVSIAQHLVPFRDGVLFSGRTLGSGYVLLFSDGTAGGTNFVENDPFDAVTLGAPVVVSGDRAFFAGNHFTTGNEVWMTDGTDAGTVVAAETQAGNASGSIQQITAAGSGVVFSGNDGVNGQELWFTDGNPATAFMVCDINPAGNSTPIDFHIVDGQLFLQAWTAATGTEPHILATPGAHVQSLGGAGGPDFPTLRTGDNAAPVLGTTVDLIAEGGPAGAVGVFYIAFPDFPLPPLTPLMQGGCNWVGLFAGGAAAFAGTSSSSLTYPLPIPNDPAFEGFGAHFQMVWINPGATPLIQLSNGLRLTLDRGTPH